MIGDALGKDNIVTYSMEALRGIHGEECAFNASPCVSDCN